VNPSDPGVVRLRSATMDDAAILTYWDTKEHVQSATGDDGETDWSTSLPSPDQWTEYLIAEEDGRPVGIVQVIDPARELTHYWGDCEPDLRALDIWIGEEADLGRGLGAAMMRLALDRCFADPRVSAVVIDPLATNVRAIRFYERLGFRAVGPRRFGTDDCLVHRLDRRAWEARTPGGRAP
jgi:aminoglycoside 6'-N-acetyltransferase